MRLTLPVRPPTMPHSHPRQSARMRIKICGITTPEDARLAVEAGADAIGVNLVGGPRRVPVERADSILDALAPFVEPVVLAVLGDPLLDPALVEVLERRAVRWVQVYGAVTPANVARLAEAGYRPVVPVRVEGPDFAVRAAAWRGVPAVLLDTYEAGTVGGTGRTFPWEWVRAARQRGELTDWPPIILAGGLTPENVAEAIRHAEPYAVDVCSGVEARPGRKDFDKMRRFVQAARGVAGETYSPAPWHSP